jgi:hypothetical protein
MNSENLIVEAKARIIWGDEPESVRSYLISNGMSDAEANVKIRELTMERNAEIRKVGLRDVLVGMVLIGAAGAFFYSILASSHLPSVSGTRGKAYGILVIAAVYGLWRLMNGIVRLVRPISDHESIPDITE